MTDSRPSGGFSFSNRAAKTAPEPAPQASLRNAEVRMPQSKVVERDIQIPDFLKRS
jgi:hypothetical protein